MILLSGWLGGYGVSGGERPLVCQIRKGALDGKPVLVFSGRSLLVCHCELQRGGNPLAFQAVNQPAIA